MAVKFGTDGTLYCNTVRYNWKQARNMIADGSYGNISGTSIWVGAVASTNPAGYRSYRSFKIAPNATLQQSLPKLIKNHKYYYSARVYSDGALNGAIRLRDSSGNVLSAIYLGSNYTSHTLVSNSFTPTYDITGGNIYCVNYNNNAYISKFIMIDLTDTFGSGNEPTREWCNYNIREQEVFINFGNVSTNVSSSTYTNGGAYTFDLVASVGTYNFLQLDSGWEPRDYMWNPRGHNIMTEGYCYSVKNLTLNNSYTYYAQIEANPFHDGYINGQSSDFYFPSNSEPMLGQVPLVEPKDFNGGGGMNEWKRISAYGGRSMFTSGSYKLRWDFNNQKQQNYCRLTGLVLVNAQSNLSKYNSYNGTSAKLNDINKEWCDRWIDGRSSPIIHIKDPSNISIKFNTGYDIVCNDIEIRPELNKIIFDGNTGTIKCKKLVRTQAY